MKLWAGMGVAALLVVAGVSGASAQPVYSWSGLYAGIDGGAGSGFADHQPGPDSLTGANDLNLSGGIFGGQIGYNWQTAGGVVWGFQVGLGAGSISGSCVQPNCNPSAAPDTRETINSVLTLAAKLGFANGAILPYITGGAAVAQATRWTGFDDQTATNSHPGWTAGAGIEWKFSQNASLNLQYQYLNLGAERYSFPLGGHNPIVALTANIITIGVNWHLH